MTPLAVLLPLLGFIVAWKHASGRGSGTAIVLAVSSIPLALFVFALAGLLAPATVALWALGLILLALYAWRDRYALHRHLDVPLVLFVVGAALFWLIHQDSHFTYYDEFSHWGIFLKELYYNHAFWADGPHIRHPRYVPGPALWAYFVISPGAYSEGAAYFAQFLLLLAPVTLFLERLSLRQWPWILLVLAWVALALANWANGLVTMYVDHLVSVWFVGILLMGIYGAGHRYPPCLLILPLSLLVLIKDVGLYFAFGAAGLILLWTGMRAWQDRGLQPQWLRPLAFWLVCCLVVPAAFVGSWKVERDLQGITDAGGTLEGTYDRLVADSPAIDQERKRAINRHFWDVVRSQHISKGEPSEDFNAFNYANKEVYTSKFRLLPFPLTTALFIGIYTLGAYFLVRVLYRHDRDWLPWAGVFAGLWLMTLFYFFVLHSNYVSSPGGGGLNVSSYMRYAHTMLLPLALAVIVPLLPIHSRGKEGSAARATYAGYIRGNGPLIAVALLTSFFYIADPPYLAPYVQAKELSEFRAQTMPKTQRLRSELPQGSRVWVHFPRQDNRFLAWNLQYQLTPLASYVNNSHPDFLERDPSQIVEAWASYDYVWFVTLTPEDRAWLEDLLGEEGAEGYVFDTEKLTARLRDQARKP